MRKALLLLLGVAGLLTAAACGSNDSTPVAVTIRRGANFPEAADSLAVHGIIGSPRLFAIYASRMGRDRTIRYGTYVLERGASWNSVLTALESGRGIVNRVRVVEGWAAWDIVPALALALAVPEDSVTAAIRDTVLARRMGVPRGLISLEGYLFPDTYHFPEGVTARQAVELMVRRFERAWRPEWDPRLVELKMSRHQIVTLASIIEKEVRKGEERPVVSAVYHNRLKIKMPLQADPTIQFALGRRRPSRVLYRDLRVNSAYNTYRRVGLPPGPIASPGALSLHAALFPANVPYRFFVAHPDGHHEFRTTYREHLVAIEFVRGVARRDSVAHRDSASRVARARQAAVDSARSAVGDPRLPADSVTRRPDDL